jgi:cardiolipin synthase
MITLPHYVVGLLLVMIAILATALWSVKRRARPRLGADDDGDIDALLPSIVAVTHSALAAGNRIELLKNGCYFDTIFREMEAARETIDLETFLCKRGDVTKRVAAVLAKKAREGVRVRIMLDARGGKNFGKDEMKTLREAGCTVTMYHPFRLSNLGRLNNRDHRKILVVDGRVGFVGGHCLVDTWLGDAEDKKHFRDLSLRVEGPVVAQLQGAFSENWIEETGDVLAGQDLFPTLEACGEVRAHAVYTTPHGSPSAVKLLHYLVIRAAKERITIQNPYFLPDPDARRALVEAVQRGVDVRIMLPAASATDAPVVQHASHHHYGTLLKGGVKIFEYQKTLLHQKTVTVDGKWSAVGSTNFDDRSFEINDEISLGIADEEIARRLEEIFEEDLKECRQMHFDEWKRRPWWHRILDFSVFVFSEQL